MEMEKKDYSIAFFIFMDRWMEREIKDCTLKKRIFELDDEQ